MNRSTRTEHALRKIRSHEIEAFESYFAEEIVNPEQEVYFRSKYEKFRDNFIDKN